MRGECGELRSFDIVEIDVSRLIQWKFTSSGFRKNWENIIYLEKKTEKQLKNN